MRALAREHGENAEHLVDEWDERAGVRCYLGEMDLDAANAAAFDDVRERLERKRGAA